MDTFILSLAAEAGLDAEHLAEEQIDHLATFAAVVASKCATRVVELSRERSNDGYGDQLRFAAEAHDAITAMFE